MLSSRQARRSFTRDRHTAARSVLDGRSAMELILGSGIGVFALLLLKVFDLVADRRRFARNGARM
jgi:hypothetical protein